MFERYATLQACLDRDILQPCSDDKQDLLEDEMKLCLHAGDQMLIRFGRNTCCCNNRNIADNISPVAYKFHHLFLLMTYHHTGGGIRLQKDGDLSPRLASVVGRRSSWALQVVSWKYAPLVQSLVMTWSDNSHR